MQLVICDLDGTLSDCRHRRHLAAAKDWDGFHELMHKDSTFDHVLNYLYGTTEEEDRGLVFLTGRPEKYRTDTISWLATECALHEHDDYISLVMRPKDNYEPDVIMKQNAFREEVTNGAASTWLRARGLDATDPESLGRALLFLEDRDVVATMWRDKGFACWQVNEGAF